MSDQMWTSLGDKIEPAWVPEREWAVRAAHRASGDPTAGGGADRGRGRIDRDDGRRRPRPGEVAVGRSRRRSVGLERESRSEPAGRAGGAGQTVTVTQLSSETVLAPLPDRDGRGFALRAGGARFSVPPRRPTAPSSWRRGM